MRQLKFIDEEALRIEEKLWDMATETLPNLPVKVPICYPLPDNPERDFMVESYTIEFAPIEKCGDKEVATGVTLTLRGEWDD